MRDKIKKIFTMLISALILINIPIYSNAFIAGVPFSFDELIQDAKDFENAAQSSQSAIPTESNFKPIADSISNILLTIAIGITVITAVMMGINFIIQSVEGKAKIKESMVPWIIGIFVTFGAFGIWRITMGIFYSLL